MKTTLEIDDELYREAKAVAALTGRKMKDLVGDGLRWAIRRKKQPANTAQLLGCLKKELSGRTPMQWVDELRGPVEPQAKPRKARGE